MKLHHTKYKLNYRSFILDHIEKDHNGNALVTQNDKIRFLFDRFYSEFNWRVKQAGKRQAMIEWLSGLALSLPCYNREIIDLAIQMGSIDDNPSDKLIDKVVENYFPFMAGIVLEMEKDILDPENRAVYPIGHPAFLVERAS